ncbi:type II secretion system protein GspG [Ferrimonas aestuarii]|uniref:Type II secretion system core protein G n=1 Tax=Ferrimonas aestuarii TaxID=2569539 RepID=A0A4V5NW90_9GAMM|nr:type II secretion system protein GspG [Ferrimonas aestuarii]
MKNRTRGFTLMELLIVMVILGLLMSLVAPQMFSKVSSTKKKTAAAQMQMLQTSIDTYLLDIGDYPANLGELRQSSQDGWDGPYLPKDVPMDPWGNPYVYQVPGNDGKPYLLMSYGKDGQVGGSDENEDIVAE